MISVASKRIIDDVKAGENASRPLQNLLSAESPLSRAEKLQVVTTILDHITCTNASTQHDIFLEALSFLRSLVPHMKTKSKSLVDTVASVERYSVNYGLRFITNPDLAARTSFLHESLTNIFDARRSSVNHHASKPCPKHTSSARLGKENVDPQKLGALKSEELISLFLSSAKRNLSLKDLHPDADSAIVASTVAGAMTILFTTSSKQFDLSQLLSLAQNIVMPWIEYLHSIGDASSQRTACAYASRINRFLLLRCQTTKSSPFDVFRVRSFAIKLGEVKLNQYAKELLQSANFLLRNKALSSKERLHAHDLVVEIYKDAMLFMSNFDAEDPKWFYEDVSSWIDNVFILWSRKKLFPRIPRLIQGRNSIECKHRHHSFISLCFALQDALYKTGALCEETALTCEGNTKDFSSPVWDRVEEALHSILLQNQTHDTIDWFESYEFTAEEEETENIALESLRLLRVLEPLRQIIVAVPKQKHSLPTGVVHVLRVFLTAMLRGLYATSPERNSMRTYKLKEELESRLQKMVGGAIQASRNLLRHYWDSFNPQSFHVVYRQTHHIIDQHQRFCKESATKWRSWVFVPILSKFESELASSNSEKPGENMNALERVATVAEVCVTNPSEIVQHGIVPMELSSLFEIAREAYACLRQWSKMVVISLQWLSLYSNLSFAQVPDARATLAARAFVEDAANSMLKCSSLPSLDCIDVPHDFILAILHDYLWWTYSNMEEFKSVYKLDQLRGGIQLARWFLLRQSSESGRSCIVDQLSFLWLQYSCEDNDGKRKKAAKVSAKNRCKGHTRSGFFSVRKRECTCTSTHVSYARELWSCWTSSRANKFSDIGRNVPKMLKVATSHPDIMDNLELRIASIEILEWIGIQLSLQSYGVFASQVGEVLRICRPKESAPSLRFLETPPESPLLDVLRLLREDISKTNWSHSTRYFSSDLNSTDLVCEIERTMQRLKSILLQLEIRRNKNKLQTHEQVSCVIAGAVVDIGFDVKNETGKRSFNKVLLLIYNLLRIATLLVLMENMADSRYYIERCLHVSSQCLPPRSFLQRTVYIMHDTICIPEASRRVEVEGKLTSMALEAFGSIEEGTDVGVLTSVITELCWSMLDTCTSRFHEHIADDDVNLPLIETVKQCEELIPGTSTNEDMNTSSAVELRLLTGMAYAVLDDHKKALAFIEPLTNHDMSDLTMLSTCCIVWCCLKFSRIICRTRERAHRGSVTSMKPTTRITRSRAKKVEETHSDKGEARRRLVENAMKCLRTVERENIWKQGPPWIQRRLLKYGGYLLDDALSEAYRAVLSIGTTFNLRREHASQIQLKSGSMDQPGPSSSVFRSNSWASITSSKDQFRSIMEWLDQTKSVLVSLSIDDQMQNMLIWRMSRTGTICKCVSLVEKGPVSYKGIICRMEKVLSLVKTGAAKPGQKFSKQAKIQWWEDRSNLDEQMRQILADVEAHWLGSEGVALLSPTILQKATAAKNSRRTKGRQRSNRKDVVTSETPESLAKALEQLSVEDGFGSSSGTPQSFAGHLILMLDTALERIPWESLPVLRSLNVAASRVPSFSYLYDCIREPCEDIDPKKLFYIINPAGDLQRTENHFQKVLNGRPTWSGFSGSVEADTVSSKYDGEEIFLYCGHGSGEQYFPPVRLCRKRRAPVALLMGCSSLRPSNLGIGEQESNGTAINFLIHGAKAVVGNLWDVTDGEIDRLTTSILHEWLGVDDEGGLREERKLSLAEALTESRPKCMLPYLVGAACVVIGVPHVYATST